eukprot:525962_1
MLNLEQEAHSSESDSDCESTSVSSSCHADSYDTDGNYIYAEDSSFNEESSTSTSSNIYSSIGNLQTQTFLPFNTSNQLTDAVWKVYMEQTPTFPLSLRCYWIMILNKADEKEKEEKHINLEETDFLVRDMVTVCGFTQDLRSDRGYNFMDIKIIILKYYAGSIVEKMRAVLVTDSDLANIFLDTFMDCT